MERISKRQQQGAESREKILDAVAEIAGERGYEGTTLSMVSKRAGLPVSSIYWHFENKDQLIAAVIERSFDRWFAAFDWNLTEHDGSALERLRAVLRANRRAFDGSLDFLRLGLMLTLEQRPDETTARERFLRARQATLERIAAGYRGLFGRACGPEQAATLALVTVVMADGVFVAQRADPALAMAPTWDALAAAIIGAARDLGVVAVD